MTVYVFIGPTLRPEEVMPILPEAVCLPPVSQGDVHRAAEQRPRAIGIIDGYFSGAPSVWHKEILWALSQGIPVFGSASMGALRAAELHAYGMRGVGKIFEDFRDGLLEDDDEVAVVHGPPESGFLAASEPMVNVRATLRRAEAEGVISSETLSRLEATAKSLFFPRRTWAAIFKAAAGGELPDTELARLRDRLPEGSVDQKRQDALEMLKAMSRALAEDEPRPPGFRFEHTHFWSDLVYRSAHERPELASSGNERSRIVDELRLLGPDAYEPIASRALLRLLSAQETRRRPGVSADAKAAASAKLRAALGLFSGKELRSWMAENGLDERSFDRLVELEAGLQAMTENNRHLLEPFLLDELRVFGRYARLSARARDKAEKLAKLWGTDSGPADAPNAAQLHVWFFEDHLGRPMPEDVQAAARALGFGSAEFDRALREEFVYARDTSKESKSLA